MQLLGFHHLAIICSNYERSKQFYTEILGFSVLNETYREERQSYKLDLQGPGGTQLELFSFPHTPMRLTQPEACGLRHVAFAVEDIDAAVSELTAKGVVVEPIRVDDLTQKRFTFFPDPDHLPIELYEL